MILIFTQRKKLKMKKTKNGFIKGIAAFSSCASMVGLSGCGSSFPVADIVVYGKIYTANSKQEYVEAFAVKDGKYIYVGNKEEAANYVKKGTTNVIDYSGGFVMPGATEGHGHYIISATMTALNLIRISSTLDDLIEFITDVINKNPSSKLYLTYGWDNTEFESFKRTINIREQLDKLCKDKPMVLIDNTGHNIFMNSKTIELAGINGDTVVEGGSFSKDKDGNLLGLATDVAMNYVMNKVVKTSGFITSENYAKAIEIGQDKLHADGYTYYLDAYTSYFGESAFKGISDYDNNVGLTIYMEATNKIDPFEDIDKSLQEEITYKNKYTTKRFNPDMIKLFADGECVETKSGWVLIPYKDGTYGTQVWHDETMNYIVKKANENGISVHVHTSGDAATTQVVNAMVNADSVKKPGVKNSLAHCFGLTSETMDLMAKYNIATATNIGWRNYIKSVNGVDEEHVIVDNFSSLDWFVHGYPLKSQLDKGIVLTSSTDYPSNAFGPTDILNIIELAVNGTMDLSHANYPEGTEVAPFAKSELISFNQALDVMTINGAKLLGIEKERGSIEVGKYADFLHIDKDIESMEISTIHTANISNVYFEGNLTYTKK